MPTAKKQYRYYLTVTAADGTKKQLVFSSTDEKEARRRRNKAKTEYETGLRVYSGKTTVRQYAETFMDQQRLSAEDRSRLERLLISQIGRLRLDEVKAPNIRQCFALLEGKSKSTISKGCSLINRLFEMAVADELILRNPCTRVVRPHPVETLGRRSMSEQEEQIFLSLLQERVSDGRHAYDIAWGIMYACGLRPGEVRALQRVHVHLGKDPHIDVKQACKMKTVEIGPPKTAAGVRTVPIPGWFVPLLRKALPTDSLFVVPGTDGSCINHQAFTRRWTYFYRELQRRAGAQTYRNRIALSPIGADLDPYSLRHTFCTNCAYEGIPEVVTMRWMGHSDPNMVRTVYEDADNSKLVRRAVERLNAVPKLRATK